jgi:hypothetical protein
MIAEHLSHNRTNEFVYIDLSTKAFLRQVLAGQVLAGQVLAGQVLAGRVLVGRVLARKFLSRKVYVSAE